MHACAAESELDLHGYALRRNAVAATDVARLLGLLSSCTDGSVRHPTGAVFAIRGILWSAAELGPALLASGLDAIASEALAAQAFPIDALFFDKHPGANWVVPAHQDRLMPVTDTGSARIRRRSGIAYAEPDAFTLSGMVALRLHFDGATSETGALRLLPGSHRRGILSSEAITSEPLDAFISCEAEAGDVLLMRPLTLHRSIRSTTPARRRVLHVVYATEQPRNGLSWRSIDSLPHRRAG